MLYGRTPWPCKTLPVKKNIILEKKIFYHYLGTY